MDDEFGVFVADPKVPWPQQHGAVASPEEIRYAEALRLQIREFLVR